MSSKSGLKRCIKNAFDQGAISKDERRDLETRLDELIKAIPNAKEVQDTLSAEVAAIAAEKRRIALLAESARKTLTEFVFTHRNARGEQDIAEAFSLANEDLEYRKMAILAGWQSKMSELLLAFEKGAIVGDKRRTSKLVGDKPTMQLLDNVVRELFGEKTGDDRAARLAKSYDAVREGARLEFNGLGGSIGKLERYGLGQSHDREALLRVGREPWIKRLMEPGVLDRSRMINWTSKQRMSDEALKEALGVAWDRITSEGWFDREVTSVPAGRGALYKQHQDHRFIHFANADEWLKYSKDFSGGDPFGAMMGHLDTMARDIAAMQVFGPNPNVIRTYFKNLIKAHLEKAVSSNSVHRAQMDEIGTLTRGLIQSSGADGWQQMHGDLLRAVSSIVDELHRMRDIKHGPRAPRTLAWKPEEGAAPRDVAALLKALDRAKANFDNWIADHPRPTERDGGTRPMTEAEEIAARERVTEIMDELREEVLLPTGDWQSAHKRHMWVADKTWDLYRGSASTPVNIRMANGFRTARNIMTAARLGSAIASAVTDLAFQKMTRKFVGIERTGFGSILGDAMQMFSQQNREQMIRSHLILDNVMHVMEVQAREAGATETSTVSGYLADRVIALQGLSPYTQAMKWAFGMEFQGMMADNRGLAFDALPDAVRNTLERNRITPDDWDKMRSSQMADVDARGRAVVMRPMEIGETHGDDLARRYAMMIFRETRHAVIEPTLKARALMTAGAESGTWIGELMRSATQFKSFGVTVLLLHGGRAMSQMQMKGWRAGAAYAVPLLITTTMLGAVALQIKELIAGRDPRSMADQTFWRAAAFQGGGFGIMGDFFNSSTNRFGGGLTATLAGPIAGEIGKLIDYTYGNTIEAADGKKTNFGRETVDAMRRLTPGANLIWTRLATERLFFDQMQRIFDNDAQDAWNRRMRNRRRDVGNSMWWQPGETSPRNAPNFSGVFTPPQRL